MNNDHSLQLAPEELVPHQNEGGERDSWSRRVVKSPQTAYAVATGLVVLATLIYWFVNRRFAIQTVFVPFFVAVLISTFVGGWKAGVLATILSLPGSACVSFALDPDPFDASYAIRICLFVLVSGVTIKVAASDMIARRRAETLVEQLVREITRHEQTESKLAASEERYRSLFENSLDAVFTLDAEGYFSTANPSALSLCGYSLAELQQMKFTALCPVEQRDEAARQFLLCAQGNPEPFFEVHIIAKEGRRMDLFITGGPIKLRGQTVGVFGIAADITERKRAQMHVSVFSRLGQQLSSVTTPIAAGRIIGDVAEELFGWDSFSLNLYSLETNETDYVLNVDTFDGQKTEILPFVSSAGIPASAHRIMTNGPELVMNPVGVPCELVASCGSMGLFASLMYVPIRAKEKMIGVLAVRSRQPDVYDGNDLKTLVSLADYCSGALQRIRAEEELHHNEQEYRALFDSDGSGKCEVHPETGRFLRANPKFCEWTGYMIEELREKTFLDITYPSDREASLQYNRQLIRGEIPEFRMEKRYQRKDGSVCWADITVTLVRDGKGQALRMIASTIDITARVLAEAALRESETRFTSFMEHLSAPAWMKDLQGRYIYVNAACANLFDRDRAAIIGRTDEELLDGGIAIIMAENDRHALSADRAVERLETWRDANGSRYFMTSRFPLRDKHGEVTLVAGIGMEITERKAAEEALLLSNQRLGLIAQVTNAVIGDEPLSQQMHTVAETVRAAYGVKACIIREIEEDQMVLLASAGVDRAILTPSITMNCTVGREILTRRGPLFIPNVQELPRDAATRGQPCPQKPDFVSYAAAPLLAQDRLIGLVGIYTDQRIRDFTQMDLDHLQIVANHIAVAIVNDRLYQEVSLQKAALEEQIRERVDAENEVQKLNMELESRVTERTRQLQVTNAELEAFAYSVSHDLRGPLRSVGGFSEALKDEYEERLDEHGREYLDRVMTACREMDKLIDDMLHLSRLTRMDMKRQPVNLSQLAEGIIRQLQESEPRRHVTFTVTPGIVVAADARLMRIALENLLNNAWKFTRHAREAQIEFGMIQQTGVRAYFVRDNGAGFDMAFAGKLFGAFQRLHSTHEFPGHGIGLATVQRIINRHGGRTWATGEVDHGASFYFTLPQ